MPTQTDLRFYKGTLGDGYDQLQIAPYGGNVPYGLTEITKGEYTTGLQNRIATEQQKLITHPYAAGTINPAIQDYQKRLGSYTYGNQTYDLNTIADDARGFGQSGITLDNGFAQNVKSLEQEQGWKDQVAAGTMREIAPGQYVPTGSNADKLDLGQIPGAQQTQQMSTIAPGSSTPVPVTGTLPTQQLIQGQLNPASQKATNLNDFYGALGTTLPSLQERAKLYEKAGLGPAGSYQGTASQNNSLLDVLKKQSSMGGSGSIEAGREMTSDLFKDKTNLQYPSPAPPNTGAGQILGMEDFIKQMDTLFSSKYDAEQDAIGKRILDGTQALGQEQNDLIIARQQELQKMGFANEVEFDTQVQDLMSSIRTDITNYKVQSEQIRNQPIPMGFVIGQQNELDRTYAIKSGEKALILETLNGYKDSASERAKELVDAKYSAIENDLKYQVALYDMNKDKIGREDSKKAQALELWLSFRQEALETQKADDLEKYKIAQEVLNNAGGTALAKQIMAAGSKEEALALGGSYIGKLAREQQAFENNIMRQELALASQKASGGGGDELLSISEATALGVPYGTTKSQAFGKTPQKPATAAQETVAAYAARLEQSSPLISSLEKSITGMSQLSFAAQSKLPSSLQSSTYRQYDQASRNFINAVLRRESGAVISEQEFDNAYKQYLPRPGDDAGTLAQKTANRQIVTRSLQNAAGPAYQSVDELLGGSTGGSRLTASATQSPALFRSQVMAAGYDYDALKKEGYTDEEILGELNR